MTQPETSDIVQRWWRDPPPPPPPEDPERVREAIRRVQRRLWREEARERRGRAPRASDAPAVGPRAITPAPYATWVALIAALYERGWETPDLARALGVERNSVRRWARGERIPGAAAARRLVALVQQQEAA